MSKTKKEREEEKRITEARKASAKGDELRRAGKPSCQTKMEKKDLPTLAEFNKMTQESDQRAAIYAAQLLLLK